MVSVGLAALIAAAFIGGCSQFPLFDPKGPIGAGERIVIIVAFALMLIVVIPVFILSHWFPWKYRASNTKADYRPKWSYSLKIDLAMWAVPIAIVIALGVVSWWGTHSLDPYKPVASGVKPISIEVVSMDWKWLFIYPDHDIAVVNQLVFPAKTPLSFRITSDTVLASFFIPQLGSQIYAMPGRQARLHLQADEPRTYTGQNQQFSGSGYADMHFKAIAVPPEQFETWVQKTRTSPEKLDQARYAQLAKPGVIHTVLYFSAVEPGLFDSIIAKYRPAAVNPGSSKRGAGAAHMKTGSREGS
ncbi:MAG: ubiquinol oxidase subunit II [Desulfobacterales bacterium]